MIHGNPEALQERDWRATLRDAISDPVALLRALDLPTGLATPSVAGFPLRVTAPYLGRMRRGDPADPLLRQVLPLATEHEVRPGFGDDPVGDRDALVAAGLLHKYRGRVLAVTTGNCAIHCRFCFRHNFPYGSLADADPARLLGALETLDDVEELILSGGDPLTLSDARLEALVSAASDRRQLHTLRLHTRVPVVLPERITAELCRLLTTTRLKVVVVIHANHPNELDAEVDDALARLAAHGMTLLNQAVLLAGVNDDAEVLATLSRRLFATGVLPYYLHLLDRAAGTHHFEVTAPRALELHAALVAELPGYLVPRLVREVPGADSKQPVSATS